MMRDRGSAGRGRKWPGTWNVSPGLVLITARRDSRGTWGAVIDEFGGAKCSRARRRAPFAGSPGARGWLRSSSSPPS